MCRAIWSARRRTRRRAELLGVLLEGWFPAPQPLGNYSVNKNYRLPYVQVWNVNIQRTVPWQVVLNLGYNGSKGSRLDIVDAPGRFTTIGPGGVAGDDAAAMRSYDYEDSLAFSSYNALTFSARKRLSGGLSLQATYTYAHSIDDATSIGRQWRHGQQPGAELAGHRSRRSRTRPLMSGTT